MADQQKGKNRAAILQELESIKGLLVDEEDIPVLQEVIDSAEAQLNSGEALDEEDLQELQQAYRDLLQANEDPSDSEAPAVPTPEHLPNGDEAQARTEVQTSLFDTDFSLPEDEAEASADESPEASPKLEAQAAKPVSAESRAGAFRRPGVTKATGENPFLPAHIRARLHGNRPPPLFEPLSPTPPPKTQPSKTSEPADRVRRAQLTDELVAEFLPQIEAALRARLQAMTEEQIQQLATQKTHTQSDLAPEREDDHDER